MTTYDTSKVRVTLGGEPIPDIAPAPGEYYGERAPGGPDNEAYAVTDAGGAQRPVVVERDQDIGHATVGNGDLVSPDIVRQSTKDRRAQKRRAGRKTPPPSVRQMVERAYRAGWEHGQRALIAEVARVRAEQESEAADDAL